MLVLVLVIGTIFTLSLNTLFKREKINKEDGVNIHPNWDSSQSPYYE